MLPIRLGREARVKPVTGVFAWTAWLSCGYAAAMGGLALWAGRALSTWVGLAIVIWSAVFFFGITNIPWPVLVALITALAWSAGGAGLAAGTFVGQIGRAHV